LTDKLKMGENVLSDFALTSAQLATEKLLQPNFQSHQLLAEEMKYIVMNIVNYIVTNREGKLSYSALTRINPQLVFNTKPKTASRNGLKLFTSILLDNKPNNFSFSELSISLLRMMHSLEFNYQLIAQEQTNEWKNPRKHLLRNASIPKTLNHIASTFCDMPSNSFMLLYLSSTVHDDKVNGYSSTNGLFMPSHGSNQQILHPEDILPYLRKPTFLIIDSDKKNSFVELSKNNFDVPLLILFGPIGDWKLNTCPLPRDSIFTKTQGKFMQVFSNKRDSIFNLFLNDSLGAFCRMINYDQMTLDTRDECLNIINEFYEKVSAELFTYPKIDRTMLMFMEDPFARILLLRFIFCRLVLYHIKLPEDADENILLPTSHPQIPSDFYNIPICKNVVKRLADVLSSTNWFAFDE